MVKPRYGINLNNRIEIINHLYLIPYTNNITISITKYIITLPVSGSKNVNTDGNNVIKKHLVIINNSFLKVLFNFFHIIYATVIRCKDAYFYNDIISFNG